MIELRRRQRKRSRALIPQFRRPSLAAGSLLRGDDFGQAQGNDGSRAETEEPVEYLALPSDSVAAVLLLQRRVAQGAQNLGVPVGVAFVHHVYSIVRHRSSVDRELEEARIRGVLRMFQGGAGMAGDKVVVLEGAYRKYVAQLAQKLRNEDRLSDSQVVTRFLERVVPLFTGLSISTDDLGRLFAKATIEIEEELPDSKRLRMASEHHTRRSPALMLTEQGLLARRVDMVNIESYWLTLPSLGRFVGLVNTCRLLLVRLIARRKNAEMLKRDLFQKVQGDLRMSSGAVRVLRKSCETLGLEFHVDDTVYAGLLSSQETGMGPLLKLTPNAVSILQKTKKEKK